MNGGGVLFLPLLIIITGYVHEPLIRTRGVRSVLK